MNPSANDFRNKTNTKKYDETLLPHSNEAEQALIGSILVDSEALHKVVEHIENPSFFYKTAHQKIYQGFLTLSERNENIDILTLSQYLKDQDLLNEVGGLSYLSALSDHAPVAANAPYYAKIVKAKNLLRNMIIAGNDIVGLGYQSEEDLDTLVDKAEQIVFNLAQSKSKDQLIHISDLIHKSWQMIEEREANKGQLSGINTGFYDMNTLTSGLQKSDLIILAARPAMGKCLQKNSEIVLEDGSLATIEEIYKSKDAKLLTLNDNWQFSSVKPSDFIDDGIKPIFEVTTRTGRLIKTTLTHPYLTINGWKKLEEIQAGTKIAVPRIINVFGQEQIRDCEVKLIGYLIGDGCLTNSSTGFTNNNLEIQKDFINAVTEFCPSLKTKQINDASRADSFRVSKSHEFIVEERIIFAQKLKQIVNDRNISYREIALQLNVSPALVTLWHQGELAPDEQCFSKLCKLLNTSETELAPKGLKAISHNQVSSLASWLEELKLQGKNSYQKSIPETVFKLKKEQLALFINRLFATDGWATVLSSNQAQLGYASVSEKLIRQVQHLLLRFGVISSIRQKSVKYGNSNRLSWQLNITDQESIKAFIDQIGIFGKEDAVSKVRESIENKKSHTNKDLVPVEIWQIIEKLKGVESWASLASRAGFKSTSNIHPHKRALSRKRLGAIAKALDYQELKDIANSHVYWDEIVSIKHTGFDQVYDLTIPDTHNFVANDICVHNTSLALNMAENIAVNYKHPVAIFSLEMSKEQLVQRLLCSRAEVDSTRVRSGQLLAEDWAKLGKAMSELGEAPLYIDDSAGVTIMELRGKCRRLQAQTGGKLGLIVIDYLQLIEGRSNDTRINQISEISRGLKLLARELEVPVIALSQLSRAVESRQDKRPMLSDLRESGCLTADTEIFCPDTGKHIPLIELIGKEDFNVLALDENLKLVKTKAKKAFKTGHKKIYKLTTYSGNTIKATENHPFLSSKGWKALGELSAGDFISTARVLKSEPTEFADDQELILLAHMIGDGCYVPNQPYHYISKDQSCLEIVSKISSSVYNIQCKVVEDTHSKDTYSLYLPSPYHLTHNVKHPFTLTLEKYGFQKSRGFQKTLPKILFQSPLEQVALFLRHLWATDGCICICDNPENNKAKFAVTYSSQSLKLIHQIKKLLLRFAIQSRISIGKKVGYKDQYQLNITDQVNIENFANKIGFFGEKLKTYQKLSHLISSENSNPNADVIPKDFWNRVKTILTEKKISHRKFQESIGTKYCGTTLFKSNVSRKRMKRIYQALDSEELNNLADSDIFWDKIKSIEYVGEEDVYDIEVPGLHNFVAENFIVHNSIEQDSDIVMFIYRDEYYNPENTERPGIADIIIAKQRSGPVGVIELLFQNNITKFKNPMKGV